MNQLSTLKIGLSWFAFKKGLGASNHFESCAFIRSAAGIRYPDIEFHFLPTTTDYDGTSAGPGYEILADLLRPTSRGYVKINSADPKDMPTFTFNFLSTNKDISDMRQAVRLAREVFAQKAFEPFSSGELAPGDSVKTNDQIDAWVRETAGPSYHGVGSCKMGSGGDPTMVTDTELRVRGIEGLRVVDASIIPSHVGGNPNGSIIMIAEKASDHILGNTILPQETVEYWEAPNWETTQREGIAEVVL